MIFHGGEGGIVPQILIYSNVAHDIMPRYSQDANVFRVKIQKDTTKAGIRYKITVPKPLAESKPKVKGSFEISEGEVSFEDTELSYVD